jgi:hypothetical protein
MYVCMYAGAAAAAEEGGGRAARRREPAGQLQRYAGTRTHMHARARMRTHIHTHSLTLTHSHTHTHSRTHTHTHTDTFTHTHRRALMHTIARVRRRTCARRGARVRAPLRAHSVTPGGCVGGISRRAAAAAGRRPRRRRRRDRVPVSLSVSGLVPCPFVPHLCSGPTLFRCHPWGGNEEGVGGIWAGVVGRGHGKAQERQRPPDGGAFLPVCRRMCVHACTRVCVHLCARACLSVRRSPLAARARMPRRRRSSGLRDGCKMVIKQL